MNIKKTLCLICVFIIALYFPMYTLAAPSHDAASQMKEIMNNMESGEAVSQEGEKPAVEISPLNIMMQTAAGTDIKSEPDETAGILAALGPGQSILVTGQTADGLWYEIYYEGRKAYIPAEMTEEAKAATGQAVAAEALQDTESASGVKAHWLLILAGVFAAVFCVSFAVLLRMDKQKHKTTDVETSDK